MQSTKEIAENKKGQPFVSKPRRLSEGYNQPLDASILHRPAFAHVEITLNSTQSQTQKVVGDHGAMIWTHAQKGELHVKTSCLHSGGCGAAFWRKCAHEPSCQNVYSGTGVVAFGFDLPGDMLPFSCVDDIGWIISKGAYICGTTNLVVSGSWQGCPVFCCSGEGGFLTHVTCPAEPKEANMFFCGGLGAIMRQTIPKGMTLLINSGLFFGATDDTDFNITTPGNCMSFCCSGSGWLMEFKGPAVIYTQNRNPDEFMKLLSPLSLSKRGNGSNR